jgi:hypothetical protein
MDIELIQWLPPVLTTAFLTGIYVQGQREILRRLGEQDKVLNNKVDKEVFRLNIDSLKQEHLGIKQELDRVEDIAIEARNDLRHCQLSLLKAKEHDSNH